MIDINQFPDIINKMKNTLQDKEWHAEGNVFIHSKMVLESLNDIEEFNKLTNREKELLSYAAFFHDIGKPFCTKEEDGRITSKGHAKLGSKIFRETFFDSDFFTFEERELIANLIQYHGYPIHYYEKPSHDIVCMAEILNINYLYILSKADIIGRICEDKEELLMNVDFFKEEALRFNCFYSPKEFKSIEHREFFLKKGYDYEPYPKERSIVTIMVGLPGVGKDHFLNNYVGKIISLDQIRLEMKIPHGSKKIGKVIQEAKNKAKQYLANKENFAWNATNLRREDREKLIRLFKEYGALVDIVYLEKPLKTILAQNKKRENSIPEETILSYLKKLEVPTRDECDFIHYIVEKGQ